MILAADIVRFILSTGGIVTVFLALAVAVYRAGKASQTRTETSQNLRLALLVYAFALALFSVYGLQFVCARIIVGDLKPFNRSEAAANKRTAVVLLGSGSWHATDWDGRTAVYPDPPAASRELEAARVFRLVNPAVIISSGGNPHPRRWMVPGGEAMRDHLIALGVPADRVLVETESGTTRDEALIVARMVHAHEIEQVILVTSETHMRRSLGAFRSVGIHAVPAIALEFRPEEATWRDWLLPSQSGLDLGAANVHELLGLAYYWVRGWHR